MVCNWELGNEVGNFISAEVRVFKISELESLIQNFDGKLDSVSDFPHVFNVSIILYTKSLLVHGKRIPAKLDDDTPLRLDVKFNDSVIEQVSSRKILGVVIDSQMNYESHIDELCKKLSKHIGLLKNISPFLKQHQRETYYNGVIKPTLLYGSMILYGTAAMLNIFKVF